MHIKCSIISVYFCIFALPFTSWLFKNVTKKLWWWEISTWIASGCLNSSFLLVRTNSMHDGFSGWKQVGLFIKHSRLKAPIKISRFLLSVVKLESPISVVLSYWQVSSPRFFVRFLMKVFVILKVISLKKIETENYNLKDSSSTFQHRIIIFWYQNHIF